MVDENGKEITKISSGRSFVFDNIKALMIFVVVSTHYLRATKGFAMPTLSGATYLTFISFDMVLFIFISGYFSKNAEKCRRTAFKTFLFPYIVLTVLMYGIRYLIYGHAVLSFMVPSLALWFLVVMFYYRFFLKNLIKIPYILPISVAVSIIAGTVPFFNSNLALGRALGFLPFFLLGYFCKAEHIERIKKLPKWATAGLLAILISYSGVMAWTKTLPFSTWFFKSSYANLGLSAPEGMLVRAGLLIIALGWIIVFINLIPDKKTWYSDIGMRTMSVYALHLTFRHLIQAAHTDFGGGLLSYFIPLGLVAITVWVLSRPIVSDNFDHFFDRLYNMLARPFRRIANKQISK
jgi:fucose 4-O-acetylase-like acetyltransferase